MDGAAASETSSPRAPRALLFGALVVVSGAAALAHEAAWQRMWTPVAGAGIATASAVVAGTLLGLSAGAWLGGRWADRAARPGLLFAAAEFAGALLCLLVPFEVALARSAVDAIAERGSALATLLSSRPAMVALACALPSAALGVSLPAVVRALRPGEGRAGPYLARLYAANTLGAVLGVLAATGWGFEALGSAGTVRVAALAQIAVALVAALAFGRGERAPYPPAAPPAVRARSAEAAAFLSGAAGLAVEIAWVRRLTPALGTTAYAFGTVLGAFLAAVALGAALLGPWRSRPAGWWPALVLGFAAVPVALLPPAVGPVSRWAAERLADVLEPSGVASAWELLWIRAVSAAAVVLPSVAIGAAALPWLCHLASRSPERSGEGTGRILAANTAGSAIGAVVAGFVAVPALGTAGVLRGAAGLYAVAAALVAPAGRGRAAFAAVAVALFAAAALPFSDDAAFDAVGATFDPLWTDPAAAPVLWKREGRVSTVVVRERDGRRELWVDGKVVASVAPTDRMHLSLLGHLPMFLHPSPRKAAVVGLGTGITATAVAAHRPEVLDVFELEPEVEGAAEAFREEGGGLPAAARFVAGDGRDGLRRSTTRYDVITSDPIHPAVAGSAELYTLEHYRLLRERLAPGGLACQWLPLYEMEPDDLRGVVRTFSAVFRVAIFLAGPDLVLVGGTAPFAVDADALDARLAGAGGEGLTPLGLRSAGRLLGLLLCDPDRARRFAGEGPLNTDDLPFLEFSAARSQYTGSSATNLHLLEIDVSDPESLLARPPASAAAFREGVERSRRLRRGIERWLDRSADDTLSAIASFSRLSDEDPSDLLSARMREEVTVQLAWESVRTGQVDEAVRLAEGVLERVVPGRPVPEPYHRIQAAAVLSEAGRFAEAAEAARAVLPLAPWSERARRLASWRP